MSDIIMAKDERISFRIDARLRQALESKARTENRTLSNMIETMLRQVLDPAKVDKP